jgi:hypothetical protein
MSGLFTRLAQQQMGQRRHTVAVAKQPLFRQDLQQGSDAMMDEPEGVTAAAHVEDSLAPSLVTPKGVDRIKVESNTVIENSPQAIKPIRKSSTANFSDQKSEFQTEFSEKTEADTELSPVENKVHESLSEPVMPSTKALLTPQRTTTRSERQTSETESQSAIDSSIASLEEPMATAPAKAIEPARKVGRGFQDGGRQHSREITEREHDDHAEQETVINVTIGRIEVKAVAQEKKKTPQTKAKSKRQPLMSLDDYQAQRQRGER